MGLVSCPKCGLDIFDTDTRCIYCGWDKYAKQSAAPTEKIPEPPSVEPEKGKEVITPAATIEQSIANNIEAEPQAKKEVLTAEEFYNGYRMLNGIKFNFNSIVKNYSPIDRKSIARIIRMTARCTQDEAEAFLEKELPPEEYSSKPSNSAAGKYTNRENDYIEIPMTKSMKRMQGFAKSYENYKPKDAMELFSKTPEGSRIFIKFILEIIMRLLKLK